MTRLDWTTSIRFTIKQLSMAVDRSGLRLVGDGMTKQIRAKTSQIPIQSRRLTAFDPFCHNVRLSVLFTIVAAIFSASLGAYRLRKEFKR